MKKIYSILGLIFFFSISIVILVSCGGGDDDPVISYISCNGLHTLGSATTDEGRAVAVDGSGNFYIAGETNGSVVDGQSNLGGTDVFVVKYNSSGVRQWIRQFGTSSNDSAFGIAVDADGNVYITGSTSGVLGDANIGGMDAFIAKYDSSGTQEWVEQFGTTGSDAGTAVAIDNVYGYIYVAGARSGGPDQAYGFLAKYDDSGTMQYGWPRSISMTVTGEAYGVAVDNAGNVYVSGYVTASIDGQTYQGGDADVFIMKYGYNGYWQWTRLLGTNSADFATGAAVDGSGNVYITGTTYGDDDTLAYVGGTAHGQGDVFVAKYNSSGSQLWVKQFGTASLDVGSGIAVSSGGDSYIVGYTQGALGSLTYGENDLFIVKYDSSGYRQATQQYGSAASDSANAVAVGGGYVYVTGATSCNPDSDQPEQDMFWLKYNTNLVRQ